MINLHVYPSPFTHESRILKETAAIASMNLFDEIHISAIWSEGLAEHEILDESRHVWRMKLRSRRLPAGNLFKAFRFLEWQFRLFLHYRRSGVAMINCHSLSTLPVGLLLKSLCGSRLVYDTHELETETPMSGIRKMASKFLERHAVLYVDLFIVVCDSIAEWYKRAYHLPDVRVIRNIPELPRIHNENSQILKQKYKINDDELLFIYQGSLGSGRGIELILDAFSNSAPRKHVVFLGFGELEDLVKSYEKHFSNIHFHPAVSPDELINYTCSADAGIHVIENTCLNHYYCLPNKIFEYILCGLPVIVSDFPEMGNVVDEAQCGWRTAVNADSLSRLLESIDLAAIKEKQINTRKCKERYSWSREAEKLVCTYHACFSMERSARRRRADS